MLGLDLSSSGQGLMAVFYEQFNKPSSVRVGEFLQYLSECGLLQKGLCSWNWLGE